MPGEEPFATKTPLLVNFHRLRAHLLVWRYLIYINEEYIIKHMYRRIKISCMLHVEWSSYVQYITPIKLWVTQLQLFRDLKKTWLEFPTMTEDLVSCNKKSANQSTDSYREIFHRHKKSKCSKPEGPVANKNRPLDHCMRFEWRDVDQRRSAGREWCMIRIEVRRSLIGSERI